MIYTVTFNPAIDYVVHMSDELTLGSTNRTDSEECYFGGKGINVSTILQNLGIENTALGFIAGFTGTAIEESVQKKGIKADFVKLDGGISRINVKIKGQKETELTAQGPSISDEALKELFTKLDKLTDGDILILAGSIPNTLPSDVYERILEKLSDRKIDFVVDATKDLLKNVLKYHPFLIKPNNHELGEMFGTVLKTDEELAKYDTIFLGFPVWWYDLPMPMWTFLESVDLSEKTVIPFFSHEGSSNGASSLGTIEKLAVGAEVKSGDALSIRGGSVDSSEEEVREWVRNLGYGK